MLGDTTTINSKETAVAGIFGTFIAWVTPALELWLLVLFLTALDWVLDMWHKYRETKSGKVLWEEVTKPMISKLIYYLVLALALHSVQLHMVKDTMPLYTIIMAIPVTAELMSVVKTVEDNTSLKVLTKLQELINSFSNKKQNDGN